MLANSNRLENGIFKFQVTLYSWVIDFILVLILSLFNFVLIPSVILTILIVYTLEELFLLRTNLILLIFSKLISIYFTGISLMSFIVLITLYNQIKLFILLNKLNYF